MVDGHVDRDFQWPVRLCCLRQKKAALDCTEKSDGQFMRIHRSRKLATLAHLYKPKFD